MGCAQLNVKPEAFGKTKTYAIISIMTTPKVTSNVGNGGNAGFTLTGLLKSAAKDTGYSADSGRIFKETVPLIVKAFQENKNFKLMPESKVLKSKAYAKAEGSDPKKLLQTFVLPPGYKYFEDKEEIKTLARDLHVDGVVMIHIQYGYKFSGANLMGLVSAGVQHASVFMVVTASDPEGNMVWKDVIQKESKESLGAVGESVDFVKLHPLLVDAAKESVVALMDNLESKL